MRLFSGLLAAVVLAVSASSAAELAAPKGEVVLTVSGAIGSTNGDGVALFDIEMLNALPGRETSAATPWYDARVTFKGPLGSALLDAVAASGTSVKVTAINDYSAIIPVEDLRNHPVILATTLDGALMSVRDKGPIFVIYPFDLEPDLYNEVYFGRSVWQVRSIEVF